MRLVAFLSAAGAVLCAAGFPCVSFSSPSAPLPAEPAAEGGAAETGAILIRAKRVIARPGEVLEGASVLVRDGRVELVGRDLEAPQGALVVEGDTVSAAFVDLWSALGLNSTVLGDSSLAPSSRSADGFDVHADGHLRREALRAGVTTVRVQGGQREPIGGLGAVLRLAEDFTHEDALLLDSASLGASVGLSREQVHVNFGPDGSWEQVPVLQAMDAFDRLDIVDRLASQLEGGRAYLESMVEYRYQLEEWEKAIAKKEKELEKGFKKAQRDREKDLKDATEKGKEFKEKRYREDRKPRAPRYDEDKEMLGRVADGEIPFVVEVHRAAEIRLLLSATRPFTRLRLIIAGGSEAIHSAQELAERRIPVIVWPSLRGTGDADEFDGSGLSHAAELSAAGVTVLFGSGGRQPSATRDLPLLVALAVGHGFDREKAFEALTVGAARAVDVADRLGTVQPGKDAELLVFEGEPLAGTTRITHVISGGRLVVGQKD